MAEINIAQQMRFRVDVKTGLVEQPQRGSLMKGDKRANRIIVEMMNGRETVDISGVEVVGHFMRPLDGDEVTLSGEAEGNVAVVELSDECYTANGHYEATVSLMLGGVERTVLFISGEVLKSGSGNAANGDDTGGGDTGGGGGNSGGGLPSGGTAGQVLVKVSSAEGAAIWRTLTAADVGALPSDGTAVDATKLNGKKADEYALKTDLTGGDVNIDLEEAEDAGDIVRTNADLLAGKSLAQIMLMMYPVGAIYTSTVATSPETLFGGTWESIGGRFLLGAGDNYAAGSMGGEETVTILDRHMPYWALFMGQATQDGEWSAGKWNDYSVKSGDTIARFYGASNTESSAPLNNMPPYLAVYMWKRTA